jgi:hypothetical protein
MTIASAMPLLYFTNELGQEQVDLSRQRSTKDCAKCPVLILMLIAPRLCTIYSATGRCHLQNAPQLDQKRRL